MIRREDFIKAMGMPDKGFERAVDDALRQVKEREAKPVMKRKMTITMLAAVLTALLLTGAAMAVGFNLFEYFGEDDQRLQTIAPKAALENAAAVEITTDALGATEAKIDSAYYDGENLIVAYTLDNAQRFEEYEPTADELAKMSVDSKDLSGSDMSVEEPGEPATDEAHKGPYGYVIYSIGVSNDCTTSDGVVLPLGVERMEDGEGGLLYGIREFATPLPKSARNRDGLSLNLPITLHTSWHWFDGEKHYVREVEESLAELRVDVSRAEATAMK